MSEFQKCLKLLQGGGSFFQKGGSSLIENFSQIFLFFYDGSPKQYKQYKQCNIKKPRSLPYSNMGAPINFRKISFLISAHSFHEKHRATCKIRNGRQAATKFPTGSGKSLNLQLLEPPINFRKISFFIRLLLVVACWSPEHRPLHRQPLVPISRSMVLEPLPGTCVLNNQKSSRQLDT